jgi:hypothetical protein
MANEGSRHANCILDTVTDRSCKEHESLKSLKIGASQGGSGTKALSDQYKSLETTTPQPDRPCSEIRIERLIVPESIYPSSALTHAPVVESQRVIALPS